MGKSKKEYILKRDERNYNLVELTQDNVERVEAMIKENSSYAMTLQDEKGIPPEREFLEYLKKFVNSAENNGSNDKKDSEKFCGSTKWWIDELDECKDEKYFKILIAGLIHNIDRTNSTHLNARTKKEDEPQGRKNIYKKIIRKLKSKNIESLKSELRDIENIKNKSKDEELLIGTIAKKDDSYENDKFNLSFATKFCHYLSYYLFDNKEEKNMYAIYDSVIAETLPLYIEKYDIDIKEDIEKLKEKRYPKNKQSIKNFLKNPPFKKDTLSKEEEKSILKFYNTYIDIIDTIIKKGCKESKKITRREFDHLVWYSNKGKIPKEDNNFQEYLDSFIKDLNKKQ